MPIAVHPDTERGSVISADHPLYVFIHLPKTGGTTFTGHLHQHLTPDELLILGPGADRARDESGIPHPSEWPPEQLAGVRVISGHGARHDSHLLLPDRPARFVTFIRDPAPLMISRFNFDVSRSGEQIPFETWYPEQRPNPTFRRLQRMLGVNGFDAIAEALRAFWFVGATEYLNDDLPHVFDAIGVPTEWVNRRVAGAGKDVADLKLPGAADAVSIERHAVLTEDLKTMIDADHNLDVQVHELARQLRLSTRAARHWDREPTS